MKEFTLTEAAFDDFYRGYLASTHRTKHSKILWVPLGIIFIGISVLEMTGVYRLLNVNKLAQVLLPMGLVLAVVPIALPFLSAGMARKSFRAQRSAHDPIVVSWTAEHVQHVSKAWSTRLAWSEFSSWAEVSAGFVMLNGASISVIPREILTNQEIVEIRGYLTRIDSARLSKMRNN